MVAGFAALNGLKNQPLNCGSRTILDGRLFLDYVVATRSAIYPRQIIVKAVGVVLNVSWASEAKVQGLNLKSVLLNHSELFDCSTKL